MTSQSVRRTLADYAAATLRGVGQVMFQGSAWSGVTILAGLFLGCYLNPPYGEGMPAVAWGALAGLVVATLVGYLCDVADDGDKGLWGFNGILVGCAVPTFLGSTPATWAVLVAAAALTVPVRHALDRVFSRIGTTAFTFPFILVTWVVLLAAREMWHLTPVTEANPALPMPIATADYHYGCAELVAYWLKAISQVFLVDSWVAGALIVVGLALCSLRAAAWAMASAAVALGVAIAFGATHSDIAAGLYGFSPVLTGIALGAVFSRPGVKSALYALAGVVFTVFVQFAMDAMLAPQGLATLTAPFCIATWLLLIPRYQLCGKNR